MPPNSDTPPDKNLIRVFVCYSHKNHVWMIEGEHDLIPHLQRTFRDDPVDIWWDRETNDGLYPGDKWKNKILAKIDQAHIALVLISNDLAASKFVREVELPRIHDRHELDQLTVIPILLAPISDKVRNDLKWLLGLHTIPADQITLADCWANEAGKERIRGALVDALDRLIKQGPMPSPPVPVPAISENDSNVSDPGLPPGETPDTTEDRQRPTPAPGKPKLTSRRLPRLVALGVALLVLIVGAVLYYQHWQWTRDFTKNQRDFFSALPWIKWVVYDPSGDYDPVNAIYPSQESIRTDLRLLNQYGINGLITSTSKGSLGDVARLAHETGINWVIVGIWDPHDKEELDNAAAAAPWTAAYCIGNQSIHRIPFADLPQVMADVRRQTRKPVTTSERLSTCKSDPQLAALGDFFFPDSAIEWDVPGTLPSTKRTVTPEEAFNQLVVMAQDASKLCSAASRPVLLKMIAFPSGGLEGFTEDSQAAFFTQIVRFGANDPRIPGNVYFSFMTSFDPVWKKNSQNWEPPENFTGLFGTTRKPKKAAEVFRNWTITK